MNYICPIFRFATHTFNGGLTRCPEGTRWRGPPMSTQPCSNVRILARCRCPLNWTRSCTRTLEWIPVPASVECVHTFPFNSEAIHCYHLFTLVSARERYPGLVVRRQGKRESGASVLKWMFMIEITPGLMESKYSVLCWLWSHTSLHNGRSSRSSRKMPFFSSLGSWSASVMQAQGHPTRIYFKTIQ